MRRIVLFDGECNFCDASVQFIIKRDKKAVFQFASLQSEVGQALIEKFAVPTHVDSIVLIEGERYYMKSSAALKIARQLDGLWKLSYAAIVYQNHYVMQYTAISRKTATNGLAKKRRVCYLQPNSVIDFYNGKVC